MVRNPGLSTVDRGSISLAKQVVTDFVNSLCSLNDVDSNFYLSHVVARDGWLGSGTLCLSFAPFCWRATLLSTLGAYASGSCVSS